ncbi:MAG: 30S ribosomal protein S6 [Ferrimicrobium sp.]
MRDYELALILDSAIDDELRTAFFERISQIITTGGGVVVEQAHWGRRVLAYPIDHKQEGYYAFLRFQSEPSVVVELDRVLLIADDVLRFKVVRLPERPLLAGKAPLLKGTVR